MAWTESAPKRCDFDSAEAYNEAMEEYEFALADYMDRCTDHYYSQLY